MHKYLALILVATLASPVLAWNEKGHLVICRLAWLQMTDHQRAAVTAILTKHPHYYAYLTKQKPDGFIVDEWAFMRAGPWADWIRGGQARAYGHSEWHYINYPICFPGLGQSEDKHQPPPGQHNAVWAINENMAKLSTGTEEEKAVALTWLCHLIGDIHQPPHAVALYSDKYPDGDRGGNSVRIRISSSPTNLHSFWDGLLGRGMTVGNIGKDVERCQAAIEAGKLSSKPEPDLEGHKTPESWAKESAELARHRVYLKGELLKGRDDGQGVLQAPAGYATLCGMVAREQIGKAGKRLAQTLEDLLRVDPGASHANAVAVFRKLGGGVYTDPNGSHEVIRVRLLGTRVRDADLVLLANFPGLFNLDLSSTSITNAGLAPLRNLKRMRYLDLSQTGVDDLGLDCISDLTELKSLCLKRTEVTDGGLVNLKKLLDLEDILDLGSTQVSDIGLLQLEHLKKLKRINLRGTFVTEEGKTRLRRALPQTTVLP